NRWCTRSRPTTGPRTRLGLARGGGLHRHALVVRLAQVIGSPLALGGAQHAIGISERQKPILGGLPGLLGSGGAIDTPSPAFVSSNRRAGRRPRCHLDTPLPGCPDGSSERTFARIAQPLRYVVEVTVAQGQAMSSTTGRRPSSASRIAAYVRGRVSGRTQRHCTSTAA